jgi:hypothetical protein
MNWKKVLLVAVSLMCVTAMFSSCRTVVIGRPHGHVHKPGPPPHAPAHGHRHKHHDDVELVFDSGCGVYVVVGMDDHYYCDGHYYRFWDAGWQTSVRIGGGWQPVRVESLPGGLKVKAKGKRVSKAHPGRGHGHWKKARKQ